MRDKKHLSIFLSFIFILATVFPINAVSKNTQTNESDDMKFYKECSNLVKENWDDNYFESLKLKVGKDYLTVEDNNKKVVLSSKVSVKEDTIMIPINEIIKITGGNISSTKEKAKINYLGNELNLKEDSNKIEVNDKTKSIEGKASINSHNVVVPIQVLTDGLGYEYKYDKKSKEIELTSPYQTMRLIAKLKNSNSDLKKYKAKDIIKGSDNISVLQFDSIEETKLACEQIKKDNIAVYVEPDCYIATDSNIKEKTDAKAQSYNSWGVENIEADKYAEYLQKQNLNNSVTVGVVDSGIDYGHSFFSNRIVSGGYDFVNSDNYSYDDNGHGTHVSGTIVDCTPQLPVKILPVKVLDYNGRGTGLNIANGVKYATNRGVRVINFSIGMDSHNSYLHDAINYAISKNVAVVVSAGNDNKNTYYACPSDMTQVIVVSAIDSSGTKCSFSNYGDTVDVAAPGENIYSAYPGGGYEYMSGTSMAAPHVSAVCAMYRLNNPQLSVGQVESLVEKNTKDLGPSGKDIYYGYGVPKLSLAIPNETPELKSATTKANLNMRTTNSTKGRKILTIKKGAKVQVLKKMSNGWYQVRYNGYTGYVDGRYLSFNSEYTPTKQTGITTANLNMRTTNSTKGRKILTIKKGAKVQVLKKMSNGWYQVRYNGYTGYVMGKYVRITN